MNDPLESLRVQLELQEWPNVYFFKFIIPNSPEKIARVTALFDNEIELQLQPSKTGKYMSISAKELMLDVDSIIERYKNASKIEGLMPL